MITEFNEEISKAIVTKDQVLITVGKKTDNKSGSTGFIKAYDLTNGTLQKTSIQCLYNVISDVVEITDNVCLFIYEKHVGVSIISSFCLKEVIKNDDKIELQDCEEYNQKFPDILAKCHFVTDFDGGVTINVPSHSMKIRLGSDHLITIIESIKEDDKSEYMIGKLRLDYIDILLNFMKRFKPSEFAENTSHEIIVVTTNCISGTINRDIITIGYGVNKIISYCVCHSNLVIVHSHSVEKHGVFIQPYETNGDQLIKRSFGYSI